MGEILRRIRELVQEGKVRISEHGYDELASDGISMREIVEGVQGARILEEYPSFGKGPCILVLQKDRGGRPVHAVWGIPKSSTHPAVLVTAYRPDPELWADGFSRRKK